MTEAKKHNYRYFAEPFRGNANEQIAARLNERGESAFTNTTQKITVGGKEIYGVYLLTHDLLTEIVNSVHKPDVRFYVQQDEGETRPYTHILKRLRKVSRSKAVKSANQALMRLRGK